MQQEQDTGKEEDGIAAHAQVTSDGHGQLVTCN